MIWLRTLPTSTDIDIVLSQSQIDNLFPTSEWESLSLDAALGGKRDEDFFSSHP
jgi:hypothetical protein